MSELKVWEIMVSHDSAGYVNDDLYVDGPPSNGPVEVVEKAEYDKLRGALQDFGHLQARVLELESALHLMTPGKRPDGTYNRDREACRQIACEMLGEEY
jgi:hypothetical protein